jgi:hypothetical protein
VALTAKTTPLSVTSIPEATIERRPSFENEGEEGGDNEDDVVDAVLLLRVVVILLLPVSMVEELKATMPRLQSLIRNHFNY